MIATDKTLDLAGQATHTALTSKATRRQETRSSSDKTPRDHQATESTTAIVTESEEIT